MEEMQVTRMSLIGDKAPFFQAVITQGETYLPEDYTGKWVVLSLHLADLTPVCMTEFMTFASMAEEFRSLNIELVGLSVDSLYAYIAWLRKIQELGWNGMKSVEVKFPLIEDIRMEVANKYGMIQSGQSNTQTVRAVFIIGPQVKIRTILYYPLSTGRNFNEVKRTILALQRAGQDSVAAPANWRPDDNVIVSTVGSCGIAKERMESQNKDQYCLDRFMRFRRENKQLAVSPPPLPVEEAPAMQALSPCGNKIPEINRSANRPGPDTNYSRSTFQTDSFCLSNLLSAEYHSM